jgi:hypothetical protein
VTSPGLWLLRTESTAEREEYERAAYDAFERARANTLVRQIWNFDDAARRLTTRVPYAEQLVYVCRNAAGRITTSVAINQAMRRLQASGFGFSPPAEPGRMAEILLFCSNDPLPKQGVNALWRAIHRDQYQRGVRTLLATTAPGPLRAYLRQGCEVIAEAEIAGERRYFLRWTVDAHDGDEPLPAERVRYGPAPPARAAGDSANF